MSYVHRGGELPLIGKTIPQHFMQVVERFPEHEAVVSLPQARRLSYRQFAEESDALARGLAALGYRRGDRIGVWSTNNIEWLLLQMATARIGVILVNINPAYKSAELAYALKRSEVQGLFLIPCFRHSDYVSMLLELLPELASSSRAELSNGDFPALRHVVIYDPSAPLQTRRTHPGLMLWGEVIDAAATIPADRLEALSAALDADDPINIQYTSGTTGSPKAVVLSHHNILNNAWFAARAMHFGEDDRLVVPVPFYHCFGMVLANLLCLSVGACVVIPSEHFDAEAVLKAVEQERCSAIHGVPTMFIAELDSPGFSDYDLSSLRTGIMAGAPCPPALMRRVMESMHCPEILIGYGQTEASPLTHLTRREDDMRRRTETVGCNLPHQEVKVVSSDNGQVVPVGEVGEVCFRGYHIMRGYYGQPGKSAEAIDEAGWLHSGDLGALDADGYLTIVGRLKDMVIRGGENIYPREIEEMIFTHPAVADVAVFGVPDDYYGEELMAWIKLRKGQPLSEAELRAFCKARIAHFKVPKYIHFVEQFPMTVTGKPQKYRMRELALLFPNDH